METAAEISAIAASPVGLFILWQVSRLRLEFVEKMHRLEKRVLVLETKEKHG
jgi:hypothetical protein